MKKMFLFAAMASVAFASCTTDEKVFDGTDESNEIRFTAAQYSAQSRAEHDEGDAFTQDIKIWSWYNGANTEVIPGKVYTPGTGFEGGLNYYWPVNGDGLDFVSVPKGMLGYLDGDPVRKADGSTTLTFSLDKDDSYHGDNLMTTEVVKNKSKGGGDVALLFRHLFSKIKVNVSQKARIVNNEVRWTVTLKSLKFIGLHDEGTVEIDNDWTAANSGNDCAWKSTQASEGTAADAGNRVWNIFTGSQDLYHFTSTPPVVGTSEDKTAAGTENAYIFNTDYYMLPQQLLAGVQKVVISYDITTDYLGNPTQPHTTVSYNKELDLYSVSGVTQWFMNKVITYNISIDPSVTSESVLKPITFTVHEEEWGAGSDSKDF